MKIVIGKDAESVSLAHTNVLDSTIPAPHVPDSKPEDPDQSRSKIPFLLLFFSGLLAAVIFAGILVYASRSNSTNGNNTPQQKITTISHQIVTTTPVLNATATDQANQTATASATSATATAVSASATATAVSSQPTATVEAATATATAYINTITTGIPALIDPLQDNSQNNNWDITTLAGGGGCVFTNGTYHSSMPQLGSFSLCFAQTTNFSNLPIKTLSKGPADAMHTKSGQTNLLGIRAYGNRIDLYINMQLITSVNDSTYASGANWCCS